ncbi:IS3 family transposase [Prosthecobacter sp.]|uniref:IS3 family transposase n=1 Tax=Prosthecobacter sp. TaxID=1965333 RepID=UPI0037843C86
MNLSLACKTLGVSRSGYHAHLHKEHRPRRIQDAQLVDEIRTAFTASRRTYGSPRLMHSLRRKGLRHGKNRITRIMRQQQLRVLQKRRFIPRTTLADKASPVAPNLLLERPAPTRPDEVWVTDITYLPTGEGWLYLSAEMDLCSRRILGWSTLDSLDTALPSHALERALQTRGSRPNNLLHHSDRGCQYTSAGFRRSLHLRGITQSMSRKANCYDNASMESFWATLKAECFGSTVPTTRSQARSMVFDYIETFYNPVRLHSALGFQSPVDFENSIQNN